MHLSYRHSRESVPACFTLGAFNHFVFKLLHENGQEAHVVATLAESTSTIFALNAVDHVVFKLPQSNVRGAVWEVFLG